MTFLLRALLGVIVILIIDIYFYQAVALLIANLGPAKKIIIRNVYWSFTGYTIFMGLMILVVPIHSWWPFARVYLFSFAAILFISKVIGISFLLIDDILRVLRWVFQTFFDSKAATHSQNAFGISRLRFLNEMALAMAAIPFGAFIYGMVKTATDYKVRKINLILPKLPVAFNGLKVLQISDIHIGSFLTQEPIQKALQLIKAQKPDVIFFTGDLVNTLTEEANSFKEALKQIQAPMGVFSVLGNHDYGDYVKWPTAEAKRNNLKAMVDLHQELGWKLLLNEHTTIQKEGAEIALIGVENWGAALKFPKYGDLEKAYRGAENYPVKFLLSHDPSHWDAQIRVQFPDIDVTFSGHTHGMQFGVEIPGIKWSPSQYFYKQWAGLYQQGNQYLYVNRGLGYIGYPGRVGILPEITVFELHKS